MLGPESRVNNTSRNNRLMHSVNIVNRGDIENQSQLLRNSESQDLASSPELRKLKQKFSKKALARANNSLSPERTTKRLPMKSDSKLEIAEDGEIIYQGDVGNLDAIFPSDGVIRIKQAPPKIEGDSDGHINDMLLKHKVPIKKQRVLLKPKKHKLPNMVNVLDEETFSDVIYDSDKDNTKDKKKNNPK